MHPLSSWSQRFLAALVPSDRGLALLYLVMTFAVGVYIGLMLATTWEVDRTARESERRIAETLAQLPTFSANNPPVHVHERAPKSFPGAGLRADEGD